MARAPTLTRSWWNAPKHEAHERVFPYVRTVENFQAEFFDKLCKLEATYDTNPRTIRTATPNNMAARLGRGKSIVTENLIATNVDTVAANVSTTDVTIRIETDGADWSHQLRAKRLERYGNGLSKLYEVGKKCRRAFKMGGALKGTGFIKIWINQFDEIKVTPVPVDNIIVDEIECREGDPRHLHYRDFFDKEDLQAQFPEYEEQIERAQNVGDWRLWAGYRPVERHEIVVIESWRLPIGPRDHKRYVAGRHTLCIDGCTLLDEEFHKTDFPFAKIAWNEPSWGYYGIGLAERILPHQNMLNRRNYQINRSLDLKADPITYVHQGDQALAVRSVNQIGAISVYKVAVPTTVDHQAVGKETYDDRNQIPERAANETGVSQMSQQGSTPAGIETGAGFRELRTTRSQRFSIQESAFEQLWLDVMLKIFDCCKDLDAGAPAILHVTEFGSERIKWSEVDMGDLKIEMAAAASLGDTPAGRQQRLTELAQAGVITLDESRDLLDHPDIDSKLSLYNSMLDNIQWKIWRIETRKESVVPSPFDNLEVSCRVFQREYERIEPLGAPEEILEALSDYCSIAANMLNPPPQPAPPGMPGIPTNMGAPMGPAGPPGTAQPPPSVIPDQTSASAPAFAPGVYAPMQA